MSINTQTLWPICTISALLQWRNNVHATTWMDLTNNIEWKKPKLTWYTNCMILFLLSGKTGKIVLEARITTVLRTAVSVSSSGSCMERSVSLGKSRWSVPLRFAHFSLCSEKCYMKKKRQISLKDSVCAAVQGLIYCRQGFLRVGSEWRSAFRKLAKTSSWGPTIMSQGQGGSRLRWQKRADETLSPDGLSFPLGSFVTGHLRLLPAGVGSDLHPRLQMWSAPRRRIGLSEWQQDHPDPSSPLRRWGYKSSFLKETGHSTQQTEAPSECLKKIKWNNKGKSHIQLC